MRFGTINALMHMNVKSAIKAWENVLVRLEEPQCEGDGAS